MCNGAGIFLAKSVNLVYGPVFAQNRAPFFEPLLVSALLDNSFKFKNFHMGVVCWQEVDSFLG